LFQALGGSQAYGCFGAMAASAQVLRQLQGGWLECLDAQGVYYYNQHTQQTSEAVPPEAMGGQAPAAQAPMAAPAPAPAPAAQPQAVTKMQIGCWTVAEDAQGEFYFNQQTGQSYDQPPAELLALVQQQDAQRQAAQQQQQQQQRQYAQAPQGCAAMQYQQQHAAAAQAQAQAQYGAPASYHAAYGAPSAGQYATSPQAAQYAQYQQQASYQQQQASYPKMTPQQQAAMYQQMQYRQ